MKLSCLNISYLNIFYFLYYKNPCFLYNDVSVKKPKYLPVLTYSYSQRPTYINSHINKYKNNSV